MLSTPDKIKHLYWRSGFGLSPQDWQQVQKVSLDEAIREIFDRAAVAKPLHPTLQDKTRQEIKMLSKEEKKELLKKEKQLVLRQNVDWVARMADSNQSAFLEKMCLFWHGHFACITKSSKLAARQLSTIRKHALGNFRAFVHAMAKDVSMIRFLNNQQNRKKQPNENFARELMELFTIGRGFYTEQDIKEAARAFTGWSSNIAGDFQFKRRQHDFGRKTFMGKTGNFDGGDIIDIILDRKETAEFITRKIYRYFIHEKVDERKVRQLSDRFYQTDYDIKDLMYTIFSSNWFYHPRNVGKKIKSPIELLAGIMRSLDVEFDGILSLGFVERALGQVLFNPPNVAGWAGGKSWIDNSTLMLRLNLVGYLFKAVEVDFKVKEDLKSDKRNKAIRKIKAKVNLQPILETWQDKRQEQAFEELSSFLIQAPLKIDFKTLSPHLILSNSSDFIKSLTLRLMTMPEYQLC